MTKTMDSNYIYEEDLNNLAQVHFIPWQEFKEKTIFVTGATGLIGSCAVRSLAYVNKKHALGMKIIALVRNIEKAEKLFSPIDDSIVLVTGTIEDELTISENVDFIIHGASQTSSRAFVSQAVETIDTAVLGTLNVLNFAKEKGIKGMVYLSSMEVYGYPCKGKKVKEAETGAINPLDPRNSYPISKLMCESMCCAFAEEYNVPVSIIRLTQTLGPGVNRNDARIFAYLLRCVDNKDDIVLKTEGKTERSYLYTTDAVSAILTILLKGCPGKAYNAANEKTYCSIAEMAQTIADYYKLQVRYDLSNNNSEYLSTLYMDLDTSELRKLGWQPIVGGNVLDLYIRTYMWATCQSL